jgi:1,4-alpha-glucan branching enzyme
MKGLSMVTATHNHIVFQTRCPEAREVYLVGDFNGWSMTDTPMQPVGDGVWRARRSLPAGRHRFRYYAVQDYRYHTDAPWGRRLWLTDPDVETVTNRVGGRDSIIEVA